MLFNVRTGKTTEHTLWCLIEGGWNKRGGGGGGGGSWKNLQNIISGWEEYLGGLEMMQQLVTFSFLFLLKRRL